MNLTINCSSDRLQIRIGSDYSEHSNRWLERSFGPLFTQWMQEHDISDIYVINWPGSFTTLRIICLVINLYVTIHPDTVRLHHCTKPQLYTALFADTDITKLYLFVGQRRNLWLYDITSQSHEMIAKADIESSIMMDDVSDEYADVHSHIVLSVEDNIVSISRLDQHSLVALSDVMESVDTLHPHYLMEPNIQSKASA